MADEKKAKVTVTLKVAMSEADLGHAAKAGDEVVLDADRAERFIAAGIAEGATKAEEPPPTEKPPAVPRRGSS